MSKYSRNSGYYDHSNDRWESGGYYSHNSTSLSFIELLFFMGFIVCIVLVALGLLEIGSWIFTGHSLLIPPKN